MFAALNSFQVGGKPTLVSEVFSTSLYTGNGSTQTITNGIDLSTKGGLVWIKGRSLVSDHRLADTVTGAQKELVSNQTTAQVVAVNGITAFSSTGFSIGSASGYNNNTETFVSWTFRKEPKFFDVLTYTGDGTNRTIAHSLGSVPGCIIVKRTDATEDWNVYHRSLANTQYLNLESAAAASTGATRWNSTTATDTVFSLGTSTVVNASGGTYIAYIFAHNAGGFGPSSDNAISCGSYTTDGSGNATINLGYEPQWLLVKNTSAPASWILIDNMRGFGSVVDSTNRLTPNDSSAEIVGSTPYYVTSTGFTAESGPSVSFIYMAIKAS
jgi:hypothetical protein